MLNKYNTDGYSQIELDKLNAELQKRLEGIDEPDEIDFIEKCFSDEIARR